MLMIIEVSEISQHLEVDHLGRLTEILLAYLGLIYLIHILIKLKLQKYNLMTIIFNGYS